MKPLSLSWYDNELWIGDISGHLSLLDMTTVFAGQCGLIQVCDTDFVQFYKKSLNQFLKVLNQKLKLFAKRVEQEKNF